LLLLHHGPRPFGRSCGGRRRRSGWRRRGDGLGSSRLLLGERRFGHRLRNRLRWRTGADVDSRGPRRDGDCFPPVH
jgi:hypothetical protein